MLTANKALEIVRDDANWNRAFHVARQDEGWVDGSTFQMFRKWAESTLRNRGEECPRYRHPETENDAYEAVEAGKAYLPTFTGMHRVIGFRPGQACNIVTNNHRDWLHQQSWASHWSHIEILIETQEDVK